MFLPQTVYTTPGVVGKAVRRTVLAVEAMIFDFGNVLIGWNPENLYRKLIAETHPDKLIARGVPKEFVVIATEKVATINEAYDQIAKERGM